MAADKRMVVATGAAVIGVLGLDDDLRMPAIERISMGRSEVGFAGTAHDLQQLVNELLDRTLPESQGGYGCNARQRDICKRALARFAAVGLTPQRGGF
jgi:hypothetical protein